MSDEKQNSPNLFIMTLQYGDEMVKHLNWEKNFLEGWPKDFWLEQNTSIQPTHK